MTREDAWELLCRWTESPGLRKHALAVEAAMRYYARRFGEDEELWGMAGLLHDLDYERYPDPSDGLRLSYAPQEHPRGQGGKRA